MRAIRESYLKYAIIAGCRMVTVYRSIDQAGLIRQDLRDGSDIIGVMHFCSRQTVVFFVCARIPQALLQDIDARNRTHCHIAALQFINNSSLSPIGALAASSTTQEHKE